jgi:uncharacterized protein (DUF885 family)
MNEARLFLGLLLMMAIACPPARSGDTANLETRRKEMNRLLADEWEYEMRESPEFATVVGDYRYNDRWSDASLGHVVAQRAALQNWLTKFQAVDATGFPEQEALSQLVMLRNLKERIEAIDLKVYLMPVDQFNGIHIQLATFVNFMPFTSTKHYEDYLSRLQKIPALFDQVIGLLQEGEKDKLMPPAYLLAKTVTQCDAIASAEGEANAFGQPVAHFPDSVPAADQKRLHDQILASIENDVRPAYRKLQKFLAAEYAPKGRRSLGPSERRYPVPRLCEAANHDEHGAGDHSPTGPERSRPCSSRTTGHRTETRLCRS